MYRAPPSIDWDTLLQEVRPLYKEADPAHDFSHVLRVYHNARRIGGREGADMEILLLAALLHDAGAGSKIRGREETCSAVRGVAGDFLASRGWKEEARDKVLYAVEVHGYSRGIWPQTLEARILQDADRLDALGAVGIARVFLTGGDLKREFYHPDDPFCQHRDPDDREWNLDHFYQKLLRLKDGMHTATARKLAERRTRIMRRYLIELQREIEGWEWRRTETDQGGQQEMGAPDPGGR